MTDPPHIAVIDIGKTNAKLALVDLETLCERAVVTRPNTVLPGPPWPHFDVEGHWAFLLDALGRFQRDHRVDGISVTTHGASAALLDGAGALAAPVLDYEHTGPDTCTEAYDAIRPTFAETGSPRLGMGLNLGAQLFWQFGQDPGLLARTRHVVTYPQYWGHRLTGIASTDVTSLGCHTDLWNPHAQAFSSLVDRLGIRDKIAPARESGDILGPILPGIAAATGLSPATPVVCGIHDSNASLLPHIIARQSPFAVVSSGTWVIVMAVGGDTVSLDPARDTLINVSALGQPVPSARFMGGREYEVIRQGVASEPTGADVGQVLKDEVMLLPAVEPGCGPFRGARMRWAPVEPAVGSGRRDVALAYYLALMTAECLKMTGARGDIVVEGPFARNRQYLQMLETAARRPVTGSDSMTGTSTGAAMLFRRTRAEKLHQAVSTPPGDTAMARYAAKWLNLVNSAT
ncbi:MAG: FGGY-family carbohydrate kinase [Rhodobacter sp.]|nr:FGGY-family carbohydrate kinase [Rhodobacter sp.]